MYKPSTWVQGQAMRIGVLARRTGISCSRIRFYEAQGVLPRPTRLSSGYRDYDARALEALLFIDRARGLGFSLAQIAEHIRAPEQGLARKARLVTQIEEKLIELDAHMDDLRGKREVLVSLLPTLRNSLPASQG